MSTITIEIKAPELAHALETLAIAIGCSVDKIGVGDAIKEAVQQAPVNDKSRVAEAEKAPTVKTLDDPVAEEESKYTLEEVRKALGDLSKAKGKEIAKGILTLFNVSKVTDLDASQYNAAMQAIQEA
jgi:hypothetical protein